MRKLFHHFFIPHHTNNFKARVLHYDVIALYILAFFVFTMSVKSIVRITPDILGFATDIHIEKLIALTNQKRTETGLPSLVYNDKLSKAAASKAKHMFENDYWAHNSPDGTTPWFFITSAGYSYSVAGENLAKNFSNSTGVISAWMNSPTHKENILREQYSEVGFAIVNGNLLGEDTTLVVQMFGTSIGGDDSAFAATGVVPPTIVSDSNTVLEEVDVPPVVLTDKSTSTGVAGSIIKQPLIDLSALPRSLVVSLSLILAFVLVFDGLYVWHRSIVRTGGRSRAHVLFLVIIAGAAWFVSVGSII